MGPNNEGRQGTEITDERPQQQQQQQQHDCFYENNNSWMGRRGKTKPL
jgi:hypothetical protein